MVSVVMPAYNASAYVDAAVRSILCQSHKAFEFIVVDDCSTDDTLSILKRHARDDRRMRVIAAEHGGISRSLNRGIAEASHPWIAVMHADDVSTPDRLEKQLAAAKQNPNVVAWGSFAHHIGPAGKILSLSRTGPTSEAQFHQLRNAGEDVHMLHSTAFLRKDVVTGVGGYNPAFDGCEDFELFDRMAERGPIVVLPEPLLFYRVHATSVTMQKFATILKYAQFVQTRQKARLRGQALSYAAFDLAYENLSFLHRAVRSIDQRSRLYYRTAGMAFAAGDRFRAGQYLLASGLLNPRYCLPRVWDQLLAPRVRRAMQSTNERETVPTSLPIAPVSTASQTPAFAEGRKDAAALIGNEAA